MAKYMKRSKVTVYHSVNLTISEEQCFVNAVLKKYGYTHGNVKLALHEAVIDWIEKIGRES